MPYTWAAGDEATAARLNDSQEIRRLLQNLTASGAVTQGLGLVLDTSNSKVKHPAFAGFGYPGEEITAGSAQVGNKGQKAFILSSTQIAVFSLMGSKPFVTVIVHDGTNVTSLTQTQISSAFNVNENFDVVMLTANSAFVAYQDEGLDRAYGTVVTALDTTPALGTEATLTSTHAEEGVAVGFVSATEVVVFYGTVTSSSSGVTYYRSCTLSGSTITPGTERTYASNKGTIKGVMQFGSSGYYLVLTGTDGSTVKGSVALYNTGTHLFGTPGSLVTVPNAGASGTPPPGLHHLLSVSSTRIVGTNGVQSAGGTSGYVRTYDISGTTLTVNAETAFTGTSEAVGDLVYVAQFSSENLYFAGYVHAAGAVESFRVQGFSINTNGSITFVGTYYDHAIDNKKYACPCYVNGSRLLVAYTDTSANKQVGRMLEILPVSNLPLAGIANETVADAATCDIVEFGLADVGLSGLSIGSMYFAGVLGYVTKNWTPLQLGKAVSATTVSVRLRPEDLPRPRMKLSDPMSVVARYTTTFVGTGAFAIGAGGGAISTGITNPSSANVRFDLSGGSTGPIHNLDEGFPAFYTKLRVSTLTDATVSGSGFVAGVGAVTVAGTGFTLTPIHFGFKGICNGTIMQLFATQADGTTETASSALATIAVDEDLELWAVHRGSQIDYYFRHQGGPVVLAATLTTNLPRWMNAAASTPNVIQFAATNVSSVKNVAITVNGWGYERD